MIRKASILATLAISLSACAPQVGLNSAQVSASGLRPGDIGFSVAPANAPSGAAVDTFAINVLNAIQPDSIFEGREYCGYILVDQFGGLRATQPRAGSLTGCSMPEPRIGEGVIASYHTHGAYAPQLDGEVPSAVDLRGDFNYGIDGYVSTPGGRVWLVDVQTRSTRMLCARNCVAADAQYDPRGERGLLTAYTLPQLDQRSRAF